NGRWTLVRRAFRPVSASVVMRAVVVERESAAKADSDAGAESRATAAATAARAFAAGRRRPRGTLPRNLDARRNRIEIEHAADEIAERNDEIVRMHVTSRGELGRRAVG